MCGIAGIVYFDPEQRVEPGPVERMARSLIHRGPDDEGFYFGPGIALANRRLSIVDLEGGHQPLQNEDGSLWVVLNGELYNHGDYREWLAGRGHRLRTRSDVEVLLHLYEEFGEECPRKLNGIFAFALWDTRRRRLLLGRDHLGVKPLYTWATPRFLAFASEIKAFLELPEFRCRLSPQGLADYLDFSTPWLDCTFFEGVRLLPPGHFLRVENGQVSEQAYWDITYQPDLRERLRNKTTAVDELGGLLEDAVSRQLMSDVPLGCFLSGGIDSSLLAALASQRSPAGLPVFSAAFDAGELYDETPYAALVAEKFGARHHTIYFDHELFREKLPALVWHLDEPRIGASIFPQYHVAQLARRHVKVCLGGLGGDELFGGYARYFLLEPWKNGWRFLAHRWRGDTAAHPVAANVHKQLDAGVAWWLLRNFPLFFQPAARRYFDHYRVLEPPLRRALFTADFCRLLEPFRGLERIEQILARASFPDPVARFTYLECKTYLNSLLITEDRMSMANSLESRVPLLDYRVVELALHLPPELKVNALTSKYALKRVAERWLPPPVLNKRKLGFPVPIALWFPTVLKDWVKEILLDPRTLGRGTYRRQGLEDFLDGRLPGYTRAWERVVWMLVNFELWNRIFLDAGGAGERAGFARAAAAAARDSAAYLRA